MRQPGGAVQEHARLAPGLRPDRQHDIRSGVAGELDHAPPPLGKELREGAEVGIVHDRFEVAAGDAMRQAAALHRPRLAAVEG
jgi:hypothetical protein